MNLYKYRYSHSKSYIKAPNNHWKAMNFKGEVYEASFYEMMISNIESLSENTVKIISKGPYTPKNNKYLKTGFYCDNLGRFIYNSDRIAMAEFDCIKIDEYSLSFYECTLTQKPENLRSLKKESLRKSKLLKRLFPNKKILCVVVSNNETSLNFFKNKNGFSTLHYDFDDIDLWNLASNNKPESIACGLAMLPPSSLNEKTIDFSYLEEFEKISSTFSKDGSLSSIEDDIISNDGLFERLYWGKVKTEDLKAKDINLNSDFVIISVNFKKIKPKIRYYYVNNKDKSVYEALSKPKKLNAMKSSRSEIMRINESLPIRSASDLLQLEMEIIEWHNKTLQRTNRRNTM
ncbi:hypothetical protein [Shewanella decolorationis]|uniref:hypothetical protein n=1 Tax=Shewanella decolorationis TaxID=256839 RepID=UPI001056EEA9|nr:hypothetical protein [Shewanella decolorationis]